MALKDSASFWPQWNENKLFSLLLAIFLVYGIVFLGALIQKTLLETREVGVAPRQPSSIYVAATESTMIVPDLATVDLGVVVTASNADAAQDQNTEKVNALLAALKEMGIEERDLKTSSYSVYPQYDYNQSPVKIVGYEASQTINVRIRNQDSVSAVLEKAGNLGATNIGSLNFEVENRAAAEGAAREKAIAKAYEQGMAIAAAMGSELGEVISYSEVTDGGNYPIFFERSMSDMGMGGSAPSVEMGENELSVTVNLTFSLE